jgi:hypothetical protein
MKVQSGGEYLKALGNQGEYCLGVYLETKLLTNCKLKCNLIDISKFVKG